MSCYCSSLPARLVARNNRLEQNADRVRPPAVPFSPWSFSLFAFRHLFRIDCWLALESSNYSQPLLNSARVMVIHLVAAIAAAGLARRWRAHAATQMHGGLANAPTL